MRNYAFGITALNPLSLVGEVRVRGDFNGQQPPTRTISPQRRGCQI